VASSYSDVEPPKGRRDSMTMNNFFRFAAWSVLWVMLAGLAGCTADFVSKDKRPKIANLVYIPLMAPAEEGKRTNIIGSFDITYIDITYKSGETVSVNSVAYDGGGKEVSSSSIRVDEDALKTSSTLGFGFDMNIAKKGDYTFRVSITDSKGRQSNQLDGTFRVTEIY